MPRDYITSDNDDHQLFYSHEQRLQTLEDGRAEIGAEMAKQTTTLEHLSKTVDEGLARIYTSFKHMNDKLDKHSDRLVTLETSENKAEKWRDVGRKIAIYMGTSGVGAIAAYLAQRFWNLK